VRTLLLGMGNPILRDDAIGVRLAADLSKRLRRVPNLDVVPECSAGGLELLPVVEGYGRLIVFDAVRTRDGRPGRWHRFTWADLQSTLHLTNVHDTNFATALELGRRLGMVLPSADDTHVFAVEVLDAATFDERMTEALERAYPACLDGILAAVETLVHASARRTSAQAPCDARQIEFSVLDEF
jgi:hydrogenase maturation protease